MRVWIAIAAVLLLAGGSSAAVQTQAVAVTESITPTHAAPGENVTITFAATNTGDDLSPFTLVLFLGPYWKLTSGAPAGCVRPNDYDIECHFASFANGQATPAYSVTATPDADRQAGTILDSRVFALACDCTGGVGAIGAAYGSITVDAAAPPPPPQPPAPPPPPPPPATHTLSVAMSGLGDGTVTSSPAGIDCPTTCSAPFTAGTVVTLRSVPSAGSAFGTWLGACAGTDATCTVTLDADREADAGFDRLATPSPPVVCTVPHLGGLTLAAARTRLTHAHCALGAVTSRRAASALVARVVGQRPAPGEILARGGKVSIVVGRHA